MAKVVTTMNVLFTLISVIMPVPCVEGEEIARNISAAGAEGVLLAAIEMWHRWIAVCTNVCDVLESPRWCVCF